MICEIDCRVLGGMQFGVLFGFGAGAFLRGASGDAVWGAGAGAVGVADDGAGAFG